MELSRAIYMDALGLPHGNELQYVLNQSVISVIPKVADNINYWYLGSKTNPIGILRLILSINDYDRVIHAALFHQGHVISSEAFLELVRGVADSAFQEFVLFNLNLFLI